MNVAEEDIDSASVVWEEVSVEEMRSSFNLYLTIPVKKPPECAELRRSFS